MIHRYDILAHFDSPSGESKSFCFPAMKSESWFDAFADTLIEIFQKSG